MFSARRQPRWDPHPPTTNHQQKPHAESHRAKKSVPRARPLRSARAPPQKASTSRDCGCRCNTIIRRCPETLSREGTRNKELHDCGCDFALDN